MPKTKFTSGRSTSSSSAAKSRNGGISYPVDSFNKKPTNKEENADASEIEDNQLDNQSQYGVLIHRPDIRELIGSTRWQDLSPRQRLAEYLKMLRQGYTQRGYAKLLNNGITAASLSAYEKGDHDPGRVDSATLQILAQRAGLTGAQLISAILTGRPASEVTLEQVINYIYQSFSPEDLNLVAQAALVRQARIGNYQIQQQESSVTVPHEFPPINTKILEALEERQRQLGMSDENFQAYAQIITSGELELILAIEDLQSGKMPDTVRVGHFAAVIGCKVQELLS